MFVKISTKPIDIVLVQVYLPTIDHNDVEIEKCTMRSVTYCIKKEEVK
jgi:hypothetical protein